MNHRCRPAIASHFRIRTPLSAAISAVLAATAQLPSTPAIADDIGEIVVTATRRSQTVEDIPYNISAVSAADIASSGVTNLQDLTHMVPGLVSPDLGPRASNLNGTLTIRGMNASAVNFAQQAIAAPLVSTYLDETPLIANIKLTDIARVEVLRGPQGTLYGSGSVGGTVRVIHNKPELNETEFDVTTQSSGTANAENPSESFDAIANLPVAETIAFRGSAGYEKLSGFTNALSVAVLGPNQQPVLANPSDPVTSPPVFTERKAIDDSSTWYVRGALLWKPTDAVEGNLSYQHQIDRSDGYSEQRPGYELAQTLYIQQPGSFQTDLGALDLSVDSGFATVSSSSSYTRQTASGTVDQTGLIESLASYYGNYPRTLSPIYNQSDDKAFTEETRLVSKQSGPWDWVAGGYYSRREQDLSLIEPILGFASWSQLPGTGMPPGCTVYDAATCPYPSFGDVIQYYKGGVRPSLNPYPDLNFTLNRQVTFSDVASFGETSYHFTDKWQATAGARIFWQHYSQDLVQTLPMCGPFCSESGTNQEGLTASSEGKGFRNHIFKLNTSYEIAAHTLLYATWSEGFRRGGVNALPTGPCYYCEPTSLLTYKPDEAHNAEVGIKGLFAGASSYTFTLYHIDWINPQIEASTVAGGFDFVGNGVSARSQGFESELSFHVSDPVRIDVGYSYTEANLTASFVQGYKDLVGYDGDRLPGVSKQQATVAIDSTLPMANNKTFHARLDVAYRTDFWTSLPHSPTAVDLPGFALLNARSGVAFGKTWRVEAFINNLTNQAAATAVSTIPGPAHDRADFIGRPRTAGIQVGYSFKEP
jgi:iron complex outermembrane recepter protein